MTATKSESSLVASDAWNDPAIAVGDAPALSNWPMMLSLLAWAVWVIFLAVMAFSRLGTNPV